MDSMKGKTNATLSPWERNKEELKARARLYTSFDGAVERLEALCLRHSPEPPNAIPERFSDGWYAQEILQAIYAARFHLKEGHARAAAIEALTAGARAGEWPAAQQWRVQQEARRRGGHAPKYLPGLQAAVDRLAAEHPKAIARDLWNLIPESGETASDPIGGFIVYRDGSNVVQVEDKTGRDKPIKFRSFCRYVTRARSK
jgi:hypothetical protein